MKAGLLFVSRVFYRVLAIGTISSAAAMAQPLAFEVAVIRAVAPTAQSGLPGGFSMDAARVRFGGFPLQSVILRAYNVKPFQVSGPAWLATERFDIEAKPPAGATEAQLPLMLQALLADRFKMSAHQENREQSVYAIVVDKGGLKIKEKTPGPAAPPAPPPAGATVFGTPTGQMAVTKGEMMFTLAGGDLTMHITDKGVHFEASKISSLAEFFAGTGRAVEDKTNLKGSYQIEFDVSDEEMDDPAAANLLAPPGANGPPEAPTDPAAFFRTVLKKLGLNVESRKDQIEMLVIDHIEKTPTEN